MGERMLTATPTILRNGAEWDRLHAGGGGLLARHPRIPDPHHPHIPVDRLEPGPRFCAPQRHTAGAAKAVFDREGASSPIPLAPETTPGA